MYDETPFSHHEPCPNCGSRDNLGVWKDGHKFCFSCPYRVPAKETIENLKRRITMENNNNNGPVFNPDDYTYAIPEVARAWLDKYGITKSEAVHYHLMWNTVTQSLVFPIILNDRIVLTNERYFGPNTDHPKYLTKGSRNKHNLFITNPSNKDTVVLVEDFISAIKVGRFAGASPLLGSDIPANTVKWAVGRFGVIRVWLDFDKAGKSVVEASKLSQFCSNVRSIITTLDPKEYSNNELAAILEKYGALT